MTRIFVDADACPVRSEIERVGTRHKLQMYVVSNGGLRPSANPLTQDVIVAQGPDVADQWIADQCGPGDVVVTSDIVLADRCLTAGAAALRPDGEVFHAGNIGNQLAMRDLMADLRSADPFRQGSGKGFTKADRSRFLDVLERLIRQAMAP